MNYNYKLPDKLFGKKVEGAYEKFLEESKKKPEKSKKEPGVITPSNIQNPDKYIILPGRKHNNYEYPDILVPIERSHFNENWSQAHSSLIQEGLYMLTIRQFADFLALLKSGNAYDGKGTRMQSQRLTQILNDIIEVRNPWRAEYLDAKFGKNTITYHKINPDGSIQEVTEPLEECLMQGKTPGISLDSWLSNSTSQGFPKRNISNGSLYYWHPRKDRVARFLAYSNWAFLDCYGDPGYSDSWLGVRAVRVKK